MKRVVTGRDRSDKSVFVMEGAPVSGRAMEGIPNFRIDLVWGTEGVPTLPPAEEDPTLGGRKFFPGPGGTRFLVVTFPPAAAIENAAAQGVDVAAAEHAFNASFPGLSEAMEGAEAPGMHTTQTVDYGVVVSGEMHLELDDGKQVHLRQGDCVVQNGTRHAWRNLSDREAVMAFVAVGAKAL
ncbi:MAG TPA: cupin domain-containing protein [Candidatus Limnocylindria bacterium]|nr:cupin domain-containing protein [Candidatus Limnocylindria bacterium]